METLNQLYPALNASNNMFEDNIQALYKKDEASSNNQSINELSSNLQYISALRNINEIRKFNEIRNAILSSKNLRNENTLNSLTIPSSSDMGMLQNEQNININFALDNMVQNQLINRIVNPKQKDEISNISNNLNLFNQNSIFNQKKFSTQIPTSIDINNYGTQSNSNANILNSLNNYSNIDSNALLSSLQVNNPVTLPFNQTGLYMNSSTLSTSFNNSFILKNNNLLSKDQIQLLYLAKLFNDEKNQLLANKERKSKFNSIIIPSNESINQTNNITNNMTIPINKPIENNLNSSLANRSIVIPASDPIENNLINNSLLIPTSESNESTLNDNSFINSITIPVSDEENNNEQLSDKLLKQFQLQEQQLASKINENSSSEEEENKISSNSEFKNTLLEVPSITINNEDINLFKSPEINNEDINLFKSPEINNENINLFKSPEIISQDFNEGVKNYDAIMKLNPRQNVINYTPLSPELSPLLTSDNINSSSTQILKNCIKKNEFNAFSSMDTLNDILSITPEIEPINSPIIEGKIESFNNNIQNEFNNNYIDPFKAINSEVEESSNNLLTVDSDYLNAPATPNSISYSSSPSNFDLSDFPNVISDSFEFNNNINNLSQDDNINNSVNEECDVEEQKQYSMEIEDNNVEDIIRDLDLTKQEQNMSPTIEPIAVTKKPRGRPRKKKTEETPKSPEEKIEQLSKTIDELLSSDLYAKLYSEDLSEYDTNPKNQTKNVCFDQDYKFIKQVNTLNYILVSYKRMCNALCKNNECDKKSLSNTTENQYDIPEQEICEKENNNENDEGSKKDNEGEIESDNEDEMDSISEEEESSESESEEKSLSLLKKEILELNSNADDDNEEDKCEENKEEIIPIRSIETANNGRKRKQSEDESDSCNDDQNKRKIVRLSIKQIKNSLENGNRMSIGNGLGVNSVSALTKNGLVLVGRKRIIAENTNRPYVCSTCGAGFVRKHDLNRHEKVHTGVKNYKCPYCERGFSRNDALSRHLRVELKHRSQANEKKRGRKGNKKKSTNKDN